MKVSVHFFASWDGFADFDLLYSTLIYGSEEKPFSVSCRISVLEYFHVHFRHLLLLGVWPAGPDGGLGDKCPVMVVWSVTSVQPLIIRLSKISWIIC